LPPPPVVVYGERQLFAPVARRWRGGAGALRAFRFRHA
jgi:hypothetical protein